MDTHSSSEPGPVQGRHGRKVRNVLFVMCDQLRADHLGCYGGSGALTTPHIDRLAAQGARFDRAYVTSAVCGPSRASFYTGRYPVSHRVTWNRVPLPLDELSLGELGRQAELHPLLALLTLPVRPEAELQASTQQILELRPDLLSTVLTMLFGRFPTLTPTPSRG